MRKVVISSILDMFELEQSKMRLKCFKNVRIYQANMHPASGMKGGGGGSTRISDPFTGRRRVWSTDARSVL